MLDLETPFILKDRKEVHFDPKQDKVKQKSNTVIKVAKPRFLQMVWKKTK